MQQIQYPLSIFLIGATGDLAKKKILKALYKLYTDQLLPDIFSITGNARRQMSQQEFQQFVKDIVQPDDEQRWQAFCQHLDYVSGDASQLSTFEKIKAHHQQKAGQNHCGNHIWYLATLPRLYTSVVHNLRQTGLHQSDCGWTKIMLEKPFGTDLATSQQLNQELTQVFSEDQIYRIDHYLAKETVQNVLVFRFANGIFEHLWSNRYVDHFQLTASETLGVGGRGEFYDGTGTVRDFIQNHVLQMIATTLMEEPQSLQPDEIRDKRRDLLHALQPVSLEKMSQLSAWGQYGPGQVDGQDVPGYTQEEDVPDGSRTETAIAFKSFVDNERWQGVPLYVRAGKRLAETTTEISVVIKETSNQMFCDDNCPEQANVLTLRVQPNEGVIIRFQVKQPGVTLNIQEVPMEFRYHNQFQMDLIEAYVKLIYDAAHGDPTLFPRSDGIEASWQFVQPFLDHQADDQFRPELYPAGSWGPGSFGNLIGRDNRDWIKPL